MLVASNFADIAASAYRRRLVLLAVTLAKLFLYEISATLSTVRTHGCICIVGVLMLIVSVPLQQVQDAMFGADKPRALIALYNLPNHTGGV